MALKIDLCDWIKARNMELQFWGYEIGNLFAVVAGIGGFSEFHFSTNDGDENIALIADENIHVHALLAIQHVVMMVWKTPNLLVVSGIVFIVLVAPLIRKGVLRLRSAILARLYDCSVVALALSLLFYALLSDTSWITIAGCAFVVASAFLRYGLINPLCLKTGGVFLQLGGLALGLFGVSNINGLEANIDNLLGWLTAATGFYVSAAGVLTYIGGIYQTQKFKQYPSGSFAYYQRWFDPANGVISNVVSKFLDPPNRIVAEFVVNPAIFWLSSDMKEQKPFITSMAARLPWRLLTGFVAIASEMPGGIAFAVANFLWAIGDIAIGSIDWHEPEENRNTTTYTVYKVDQSMNNSALLILPGALYTDGSKSVLAVKLNLKAKDIQALLKERNERAELFHIVDRTTSDKLTSRKLSAHIFENL